MTSEQASLGCLSAAAVLQVSQLVQLEPAGDFDQSEVRRYSGEILSGEEY